MGTSQFVPAQDPGIFTPNPFVAGNFSGNGTMTVVVTAQTDNRYKLVGKTLFWQLYIAAGQVTIGGVVNTEIRCTLPLGLLSKGAAGWNLPMVDGNGTALVGRAYALAGDAFLTILKDGGVNWTAGASGQIGPFSIVLEVQ